MRALSGSQDFLQGMVNEYQMRRDKLVDLLNQIPGVHTQKPQGAFYVFPNVKSFGISERVIQSRLLDDAGVAVIAGSDFGPGGSGYLRLCYATSMDIIEQSMERVKDFFTKL